MIEMKELLSMEHVEIRGARVPALGLGTWQLEGEACRDAVEHALSLGYRHIDTAQGYENEAQVGAGLRNSGVPREEVWVTTKVWIDNLQPRKIAPSVDESLGRLGLDEVELILLHWPIEDTPLLESLEALAEVRAAGKTKHIGISNCTPSQVEAAVEAEPVFCNQVEYHPFLAQNRLRALALEHDHLFTAYSPLAQGKVLEDDTLKAIGEEHGKSAAQVTLRWLVQQKNVCAIPRSASAEHRAANLDIFDFTLDDEEMERIHGLARNERLIDPPFAPVWDT